MILGKGKSKLNESYIDNSKYYLPGWVKPCRVLCEPKSLLNPSRNPFRHLLKALSAEFKTLIAWGFFFPGVLSRHSFVKVDRLKKGNNQFFLTTFSLALTGMPQSIKFPVISKDHFPHPEYSSRAKKKVGY